MSWFKEFLNGALGSFLLLALAALPVLNATPIANEKTGVFALLIIAYTTLVGVVLMAGYVQHIGTQPKRECAFGAGVMASAILCAYFVPKVALSLGQPVSIIAGFSTTSILIFHSPIQGGI